MRLFAIGAVIGLLGPSVAGAQLCLGKPSLGVAPVSLELGFSGSSYAKGVGGRFGFGSQTLFGGLSIGYVKASDIELHWTPGAADIGYVVPLGAAKKVQLCPVAEVGYTYGPNDEAGSSYLKASDTFGSAGLAIGGEVEVSPGFHVVPNAQLSYGAVRSKVTINGRTDVLNFSGADLGAGISLLFSRVFALSLGASLPVAQDGEDDPVFSVGFTIGFKR